MYCFEVSIIIYSVSVDDLKVSVYVNNWIIPVGKDSLFHLSGTCCLLSENVQRVFRKLGFLVE